MRRLSLLVSGVVLLTSCSGNAPTGGDPSAPDPGAELSCTIPVSQIQDGGPGKDGIPSLTNPPLVSPNDSMASYLIDADRVMGFVVDGEATAVPLNVLWWHEIVNLDVAGRQLAVTHCPLTGSSLIFDRGAIDGATFGVSGLLYLNNLMMYDRTNQESLWPQMARGARCGPRGTAPLDMYPTMEMTWAGWRSLYPDTKVVGARPGPARTYRTYPYGNYDEPSNPSLLFPLPGPIDTRRPPKERVLGIPAEGATGLALPYGALDDLGPLAAVHAVVDGADLVVFWDRQRQAAAAYFTRAAQGALTFSVDGGFLVDAQTSSTWQINGLATSGPLAGTRLTPFDEAFVAFWFAWAAFYPDADLWQ